MVDADPELEARPESVYDALRGSTSRYFLTAVYTEIFTLLPNSRQPNLS
jgi:hypothetical protein